MEARPAATLRTIAVGLAVVALAVTGAHAHALAAEAAVAVAVAVAARRRVADGELRHRSRVLLPFGAGQRCTNQRAVHWSVHAGLHGIFFVRRWLIGLVSLIVVVAVHRRVNILS